LPVTITLSWQVVVVSVSELTDSRVSETMVVVCGSAARTAADKASARTVARRGRGLI
jgi:hypothetical protein